MRTLVLGCGMRPLKGADVTNVDILKLPGVDVVINLNRTPWPFIDGTFERVVAEDIIEHLGDVIKVMEEIWRVLAPAGEVFIRTVDARSPQAWDDPTHRHMFTLRSFDYFDPRTQWGQKYGYYTKRKFTILEKAKAGEELVFRLRKEEG